MIPSIIVVGALFGIASALTRRVWVALAGLGIVAVLWSILVLPAPDDGSGVAHVLRYLVLAMVFAVGNYLVGLGVGLIGGIGARVFGSSASRLMRRS